ncbi:MAG: hypothetical protein CME38_06135 [Haliea sp.]|nr:hypothetical protein [Haliea sp.]
MSRESPIAPQAFTPLDSSGPAPTPPPRRGRWLVTGALLACALALLFLFIAVPVTLEVESTREPRISVGGPDLQLGKRFLMLPGEHSVRLEAPGYQPLESRITVARGGESSFSFTLEPLPGELSVTSHPAGATLWLEGENCGTTPVESLSLPPGEYQLRLEHPRYLPHQQTLAIEGRGEQQTLAVDLLPAWADLRVDSSPGGATVHIDGEAVGSTPATLEVLQGERRLVLELAGFAPLTRKLDLVAGETQDLGTLTLQPAAGVLVLSSQPGGANVTLAGEFLGQTPLEVELPPDQARRLLLTRPGYRRHSETVQLAAGSREEKRIRLQPQLGDIQLEVSPAAAEVRVNGRPVGQGSQSLSLPAVEQRIEVRLAGHATETRRVTPRPGLAQRLVVTLQTAQEARLASLPEEITTSLGQTLRLFVPGESGPADFTMGASRREPGRRANETLRPVRLRRLFYLQTTEVTNAQFRQFLASHNAGQVQGASLNREHQPAVQVSWQQAARFCNWLSEKEGLDPFYTQQDGIITGFRAESLGYRLPSEAEWAWAARVRGETLLTFPWGEGFPPTQVLENYADTSAAYITGRVVDGYNDGNATTATVGSFPANHHGLHDLGGNAAEWVHDVYRIPPAGGDAETDPLGPASGDNYVIRGASWAHSKLAELRLAWRDYGQAARDDVGFRLARYAEPAP